MREEESAGARSSSGASGWIEELRRTGEEISGVFRETAALIGVESRLFVTALLFIALLAVALGCVIASVALLAGVAFILLLIVHAGLDPVLATLVGMAVLIALAGFIVWRIRALTQHLRFTHSRKALSGLAGTRAGQAEKEEIQP